MAELFEATSAAVFECQSGPIFHLEFDAQENLVAFLKYLREPMGYCEWMKTRS